MTEVLQAAILTTVQCDPGQGQLHSVMLNPYGEYLWAEKCLCGTHCE